MGQMPDPGMAVPYEGGYLPPGLQPWPAISPFDHRFSQHVNRGGLWQYRENDSRNKFYFDVEYWIARNKQPGTELIGNVRSDLRLNLPTEIGDTIVVGPGSIVDTDGTAQTGVRFRRAWQPFDTDQFSVHAFDFGSRAGGRLRLGWMGPDDSGVEFSGWSTFRATDHAGPGRVFDGINLATLNTNLGSIALDDGNNLVGGAGRYLHFDQAFSMYNMQQLYGADIDWMMTPVLEREKLKVRVLTGVRYMNVNERFSFLGRRSTLLYTATDRTDSGIGEFLPVDMAAIGVQPLQTDLTSQVVSNFVGPSLGLKYEIGGDAFKVWGVSKVTAAVNMHEFRLSGRGFRETYFVTPNPPPATGYTVTPGTPGPAFGQHSSVVSVSPIFEQGVYGQFPLREIPLIKRVPFLRSANFKAGYTIIWVGNIARPAQSVFYQYTQPALRPSRSSFFTENVNVGLNWTF
jgi:hypothetical protein